MPEENTIYDLMLLLSTAAPEDERAKILSDVEAAIGGGGSIERRDDWGTRRLTFRINHQADAEYHLLQFSGPPSLLESLSHSLRIDDRVLRFRIIKVLPGQPPPPDSAPPVLAAAAAPSAAAPAAAPEAPPESESES
jgi:small subunit ribosomal protein S6